MDFSVDFWMNEIKELEVKYRLVLTIKLYFILHMFLYYLCICYTKKYVILYIYG